MGTINDPGPITLYYAFALFSKVRIEGQRIDAINFNSKLRLKLAERIYFNMYLFVLFTLWQMYTN